MLSHSLAFVLAYYVCISTAVPTPGTTCHLSKSISWGGCDIFGYNDTLDAVKPQCGYFTVPADYRNCAAGSVNLAVARRPAAGKPKLGTIFVNPGGPGGSGTDYVLSAPALGDITGNQHDIVSWDPRGVGYTSLQINCFDSTDQEAPYFQPDSILSFGPQARGNFTNPQHNDPDEIAFWKKENETDSFLQSITSACIRTNGANLTYIGTAAAVRDMLSLSEVIDGPGKPVNYWGVSYGTAIGAYFVNMFPNRVGRVILDGVLNPIWWTQNPQYQLWSGAIADADSVRDEFTRSCAQAGPEYCAIATKNSTQADIAAWLQNLIDLTFDHPLEEITSSLVRAEIHAALYDPTGWADVAKQAIQLYQALLAAANTSSTLETRSFMSPYLQQPQRTRRYFFPNELKRHSLHVPSFTPLRAIAAGTTVTNQKKALGARNFADGPVYDFYAPSIAISCADAIDTPNTTTVDVFNEMIEAASTVSQMFGPRWFASMYCHRWTLRAVERYQGPWNRKLANKILIIGNKGDPITPLASSKKLAELLGPRSAVLLERDGYGHTSLAEESICTNRVITKFMVHGKLPAPHTVCATNKNYFNVPNISNSSSGSWIGSV